MSDQQQLSKALVELLLELAEVEKQVEIARKALRECQGFDPVVLFKKISGGANRIRHKQLKSYCDGLGHAKIDHNGLHAAFEFADRNRDGHLCYSEFMRAFVNVNTRIGEHLPSQENQNGNHINMYIENAFIDVLKKEVEAQTVIKKIIGRLHSDSKIADEMFLLLDARRRYRIDLEDIAAFLESAQVPQADYVALKALIRMDQKGENRISIDVFRSFISPSTPVNSARDATPRDIKHRGDHERETHQNQAPHTFRSDAFQSPGDDSKKLGTTMRSTAGTFAQTKTTPTKIEENYVITHNGQEEDQEPAQLNSPNIDIRFGNQTSGGQENPNSNYIQRTSADYPAKHFLSAATDKSERDTQNSRPPEQHNTKDTFNIREIDEKSDERNVQNRRARTRNAPSVGKAAREAPSTDKLADRVTTRTTTRVYKFESDRSDSPRDRPRPYESRGTYDQPIINRPTFGARENSTTRERRNRSRETHVTTIEEKPTSTRAQERQRFREEARQSPRDQHRESHYERKEETRTYRRENSRHQEPVSDSHANVGSDRFVEKRETVRITRDYPSETHTPRSHRQIRENTVTTSAILRPTARELIASLVDVVRGFRRLEERRETLAMEYTVDLSVLFDLANAIGGHKLTTEDLVKWFRSLDLHGVTEDRVWILVSAYDKDKDGALNFAEFSEMILPYQSEIRSQAVLKISLNKTYKRLDQDTEKAVKSVLSEVLRTENLFAPLKTQLAGRLHECLDLIGSKRKHNPKVQDIKELLASRGLETTTEEVRALMHRLDLDPGNFTREEFIADIDNTRTPYKESSEYRERVVVETPYVRGPARTRSTSRNYRTETSSTSTIKRVEENTKTRTEYYTPRPVYSPRETTKVTTVTLNTPTSHCCSSCCCTCRETYLPCNCTCGLVSPRIHHHHSHLGHSHHHYPVHTHSYVTRVSTPLSKSSSRASIVSTRREWTEPTYAVRTEIEDVDSRVYACPPQRHRLGQVPYECSRYLN